MTGWGTTSAWGFFWEDKLREVTVPIVSIAACQLAYDDMDVTITSNILSAGEDGLDACFYDSGGAFVVQNAAHNGYLLAGVVSFGHDDGWGRWKIRRIYSARFPGLDKLHNRTGTHEL